MATRVELEVSDNGLSFLLDDAVKGVLDNTTYTLRNAWADISEWVYSVNIKRGRNREYDRFSAGTLQVELRNHERTFDPTYAFSPFFGEIFPRRMIRVFTDDVIQFVGFIEDWEFSYSPGGESLVSVSASDTFTKFSQFELQDVAVSEQLTGARVNAILNEFGWPVSDRNVDVGSSVVAAGTATGSALSYLQQVETSELGYMFMGKDGSFKFRQRNNALGDYVPVEFTDDGSGVGFDSVDVSYSTDTMSNQAFVAWSGGTVMANTISTPVYEVRRNYVSNPSFETNAALWSGNDDQGRPASIVRASGGWVGSYGGYASCNFNSAFMQVTSYAAVVETGAAYTLSMYVKPQVTRTIYPVMSFFLSGGGYFYIEGTPVTCSSTSWTRVSVSGFAHSDATNILAGFVVDSSIAKFETVAFDGVLLEKSATLGSYFDGSFTDTSVWDYGWVSTAHASESTATRLVSAGSDSQTKYGVISRDVETLLASESTATEFAQYFVARYSEPEYNVNAVTVTLDRSSEDAAKLLSLDIGDLVSIRFTPNGFGEPIVKLAEVLKLEHSIGVDRHVMTVGISGKQFIGFTLDSVEFGILDTDMLAF